MLITEQESLKAFCDQLRGEKFITIDTEFLREKTYYPKLCLIQISGADGKAAAIDPLIEGLDLQPVYELLFNSDILKVFHAGRQDLEIFFNLTGKVVTPIFDTQIAAMVCGYGDSVGYESLVKNVTGQQVDKSSQFTDWSRRPLSDKQLSYALGDVTYLIDVYKSLAKQLDEKGRTSWVLEEEEILANPKTYEVDFDLCWKRIKIRTPKPKTLVVLRALAAWREQEAQRRNMPKNWVMRDETLADMAAQAPKDVKALQRIRNMSGDVAAGPVGKKLLKLIKEAISSSPDSWPRLEKKVLHPLLICLDCF